VKPAALLLLLAAILFTTGCAAADTEAEPESLAWSVYAGEDAAGLWATFAFTKDEDGADVLYYFPDNAACYSGGYSCAGGRGAVTTITSHTMTSAGAPPPPPEVPAPGAFVISPDEKTITFVNYGGKGERSFPRRRSKGGSREHDDPPPVFPSPPGSLDGTVWAATAYRSRDWTTLVASAESESAGSITVSHSFDCTSYPRRYGDYHYDAESNLSYIGPFKVSGSSFTFLDFYGHGGEITHNRLK
jgi:hypothetical protein